jgi:WD40 repeat protein
MILERMILGQVILRRWLGALIALAVILPVGLGQTITYTLPEQGQYRCAAYNISALSEPDLNGSPNINYGVQEIASIYGNLVLEANNRYRLTNGGGGTYTAKPNGEIRFSGLLSNPKLKTYFNAKNGAFNVYIESLNASGKPLSRVECTRRSKAARVILEGGPNPGLPGTIVYYSKSDSAFRQLKVAAGELKALPAGEYLRQARNGELILENAANELVIASLDGQVRARLTEEVRRGGSTRIRDGYTLSPDGKRYAYNIRLQEGPAVLVRDRNGQLLATIPGFQSPDFLPDGRLLLSGLSSFSAALSGLSNPPQGVFLTDNTYDNPRRIDPNLSAPLTPAASPDGRFVAFVNNKKLHVMNLDGTGLRTLPLTLGKSTAEAMFCPVWSPDGKWIAVIAEADNAPYTGELLVSPVNGDAKSVQVLVDAQLNLFQAPDRPMYCLSWR